MAWWEAILLGLVQGIAEFLPISSSGHLVLGQYLLGLNTEGAGNLVFDIFVHFGTVCSILTVYRRRILDLFKDAFRLIHRPGVVGAAFSAGTIEHEAAEPLGSTPPGRRAGAGERRGELAVGGGAASSVRLLAFILLSMVPTALVYVLFDDALEGFFDQPRVVCAMLLVTGTLLLLTRVRPNPQGVLSPLKALVVGLAQGAALMPGISRSGSTICAAIYMDVDRKQAADFSFLMSLPVILGATLLQVKDLVETGAAVDWVPLVLGTLVAYAAGVWAIKVVLAFVQRGDLRYFAYYLFVAGTLGLLFI